MTLDEFSYVQCTIDMSKLLIVTSDVFPVVKEKAVEGQKRKEK